MSDISTVYAALVTRIEAVLTSHTRLGDPYTLEQNKSVWLKKGWGLAIGEGVNTNQFLSNKVRIDSVFNIPITRKYYAKEDNADLKSVTELQILEDIQLLVADFHTNSTLTTATNHVNFIGRGPMEPVFDGKDQFLACRMEIAVNVIETLS